MSKARSEWARQVIAGVDRSRVEFVSARCHDTVVTVALERGAGRFGAAFCSPKDSHDRHLGQAIALQRLEAFRKRGIGQFTGDLDRPAHGVKALCDAVSLLAEAVPEFFGRRQDLLRSVADWQARMRQLSCPPGSCDDKERAAC